MFVIHRGAGMLAPAFGLLFALLANVLTFRIFGGSYYEEHSWPKFGVLVMSGLACLIVGLLIKKIRERNAHLEQQAIDSLSQKHEIANELAFFGPRDHLMFIPLPYWSIVYFAGALVYLLLGPFGSSPAVSQNRKSPSSSGAPPVIRREQTTPVMKQTVTRVPLPTNLDEYRNLLFSDQRLEELVTRHHLPDDPFAKAYQYVKAGKTHDAKKSLGQVLSDPKADVRERLLAWRALRQLGENPPSNIASEVQGVVMEVPTDYGIDTLAAYSDGRAQYLNGRGAGSIVWDAIEENAIGTLVKNFVNATKPLVDKAPLYDKHQSPKKGVVRVTILTYGGIRILEGEASEVIDGRHHLLSYVGSVGTDLFVALIEASEK